MGYNGVQWCAMVYWVVSIISTDIELESCYKHRLRTAIFLLLQKWQNARLKKIDEKTFRKRMRLDAYNLFLTTTFQNLKQSEFMESFQYNY